MTLLAGFETGFRGRALASIGFISGLVRAGIILMIFMKDCTTRLGWYVCFSISRPVIRRACRLTFMEMQ
jgi:hypothetical protein